MSLQNDQYSYYLPLSLNTSITSHSLSSVGHELLITFFK